MDAYLSPRAFVIIKLNTSEDRDRVIREWNKSFFGKSTQAISCNHKHKTSESIIAKNVPTTLTESDILIDIKQVYPHIEKLKGLCAMDTQ
jgi:hypothetical protein